MLFLKERLDEIWVRLELKTLKLFKTIFPKENINSIKLLGKNIHAWIFLEKIINFNHFLLLYQINRIYLKNNIGLLIYIILFKKYHITFRPYEISWIYLLKIALT